MMTQKQKKRHRVLMLQLQLQKIQILQEQQALGRVVSGNNLNLIARETETLRELNDIRDKDENRMLMVEEFSSGST